MSDEYVLILQTSPSSTKKKKRKETTKSKIHLHPHIFSMYDVRLRIFMNFTVKLRKCLLDPHSEMLGQQNPSSKFILVKPRPPFHCSHCHYTIVAHWSYRSSQIASRFNACRIDCFIFSGLILHSFAHIASCQPNCPHHDTVWVACELPLYLSAFALLSYRFIVFTLFSVHCLVIINIYRPSLVIATSTSDHSRVAI